MKKLFVFTALLGFAYFANAQETSTEKTVPTTTPVVKVDAVPTGETGNTTAKSCCASKAQAKGCCASSAATSTAGKSCSKAEMKSCSGAKASTGTGCAHASATEEKKSCSGHSHEAAPKKD